MQWETYLLQSRAHFRCNAFVCVKHAANGVKNVARCAKVDAFRGLTISWRARDTTICPNTQLYAQKAPHRATVVVTGLGFCLTRCTRCEMHTTILSVDEIGSTISQCRSGGCQSQLYSWLRQQRDNLRHKTRFAAGCANNATMYAKSAVTCVNCAAMCAKQ